MFRAKSRYLNVTRYPNEAGIDPHVLSSFEAGFKQSMLDNLYKHDFSLQEDCFLINCIFGSKSEILVFPANITVLCTVLRCFTMTW